MKAPEEAGPDHWTHQLNRGRIEPGSHILAARQIFIVSDIIRTGLHVTAEDIALPGGLVLIRSAISSFLEREHKHLQEEES